jgi:hypothetical protein
MEKMDSLPEYHFKNERTDHVNHLLIRFRNILVKKSSDDRDTTLFSIWVLKFILKLLVFQSLPLRLLACDILKDMIEFARENKEFPPKYIVQGAGTESMNGIYHLAEGSKEGDQYHPTYEKIEDGLRVRKNDHFTPVIFRARTGSIQHPSYLWFISDRGDDLQNIDYYINRGDGSSKTSLYAPPMGWALCGTARDVGEKPCPVVFPYWGEDDSEAFDNASAPSDGMAWW